MDILQKIKKGYPICKKETAALQYHYIRLKKKLSANDKKLLLRIVDGKDLLIETAAYENFEHGFCIGIQLAANVFRLER
jgi:hypothetical protein